MTSMLVAAIALGIIWCVATVMMYFGVLIASQTIGDCIRGYVVAEPSPLHNFLALLVTLVWCAITANLPL